MKWIKTSISRTKNKFIDTKTLSPSQHSNPDLPLARKV